MPTKIGVRNQGSDFQVFKQIFGRQEYSVIGDLGDVDTVIDCGANVGLASLFFWLRYQPRRIIAVEPDPGNAALCRTNLEGLGPSVQVIQAAVWPIPTDLAISRGVFRDGSDWTGPFAWP